MRLGYFTMPMHPLDTDYTTTLKQDREAIMLCDKLGYHDAFVGEHLTDDAENITNSMLFLGTLIHSTENIILGTGTTNLTHTHPVLVASHAAMFDHLAEGRFILGISPGTLRSDREVLGIANEDINKMFEQGVVTHFLPSGKPYMRTVGVRKNSMIPVPTKGTQRKKSLQSNP